MVNASTLLCYLQAYIQKNMLYTAELLYTMHMQHGGLYYAYATWWVCCFWLFTVTIAGQRVRHRYISHT